MISGLSRNQELELLSALDSRPESPLKFAYIVKGYKEWIEIAKKSREEHTTQFDENILKNESLPHIFRNLNTKIQYVNIIDLGCGDGVPMISIFKYLRHIPHLRYIPVDISQHMLSIATKTIRRQFPHVSIVPILTDLEKGEIKGNLMRMTKAKNTMNYFFLLGNTLGNFDNTEKILSNVKLSMFTDDSLIIGNQISNLLASPKLTEYYHTKNSFNLAAATLLHYKMECNFSEYTVRWNSLQKQIEISLKLCKDKDITIADYTVHFESGEEILLAISRKYVEETLVKECTTVGFRIDLLTTNAKKNTCIISVKPTRYKS